jgi:hypothetical protein
LLHCICRLLAQSGHLDASSRMSASLIGHSGSSTFRPSTTPVSMSLAGSRFSSDSAPRALPSWDSKTRWNNLSGDLAVNMTAGSSGHTNSPHPSSREGHHSTVGWSSISSYCIGSCTDLKLLRLSGDLAVNMTAGSSGHTNSPHPSSREGHHSTVGWSSISSYCIGSCTDLKLLRLPWSTGIRCRQPTRGA